MQIGIIRQIHVVVAVFVLLALLAAFAAGIWLGGHSAFWAKWSKLPQIKIVWPQTSLTDLTPLGYSLAYTPARGEAAWAMLDRQLAAVVRFAKENGGGQINYFQDAKTGWIRCLVTRPALASVAGSKHPVLAQADLVRSPAAIMTDLAASKQRYEQLRQGGSHAD